jgi:hypothetical protein
MPGPAAAGGPLDGLAADNHFENVALGRPSGDSPTLAGSAKTDRGSE